MKQIEKLVEKHQQSCAQVLYDKRVASELTQEQLAVKAGVDRKTINRIENGHFSPSLTTLVRLASALKTPIAELVG